MNTLTLVPKTERAERQLQQYGPEWLVVGETEQGYLLLDLDEQLPGPVFVSKRHDDHYTLKEPQTNTIEGVSP